MIYISLGGDSSRLLIEMQLWEMSLKS